MDNPAVSPIHLMDPYLYKALVAGNAELDEVALWRKLEQLGILQVTPKGNTILHIVALHGYTHFVNKILEEFNHASSLLCAQNKKNETALHIAAREGHTDMVSALIHYAKTCPELESGINVTYMMRMTDDEKDTALHKAVRNGHLEVVKFLVKEDPEFQFLANEPIYLAAELQFLDCLRQLLNTCKRPVYGGPLGQTALHAAIINYIYLPFELSDCTKLLEKEVSLCEVADDWGWSPLHYICCKTTPCGNCSQYPSSKSSVAYVRAGKEGEWTTAIHIAVRENSIPLFKQILQHCPHCWEMVNSKYQNVLHDSILSNATEMTVLILDSLERNYVIDEKDEDGNTPLHLLAAYSKRVRELKRHPRLKGSMTFNKQQSTLLDIAYKESETEVYYYHLSELVGNNYMVAHRDDITKKLAVVEESWQLQRRQREDENRKLIKKLDQYKEDS